MKKNKITKKDTASRTQAGNNLQMEQFCISYTGTDRELFGNGVKAYLEVYGPEYLITNKKIMSYEVAMASASRLLRNVKVINRINELLEEGGFNDRNVDKQHLFLLNQHADLKTKLGAIKEYNTLKRRIDSPTNIILINNDNRNKFNKALEYLDGGNKKSIKRE